MRVIFMGTPEIAVPTLEALIERGHEVAAVVTQPDRPAGRGNATASPAVKQAAIGLGLRVLQPVSLKDRESRLALEALHPDACVVFAYGEILRRSVLEMAPLGCLNVHPSLLPKLRGASPISSAILEGLTETGVTVMLMDRGMDTGPILASVKVVVLPDDDTPSLGKRLAEAGASLLVETLDRWSARDVEPQIQDESAATYSRLTRKGDGEIDWREPAVLIERKIRAYRPWPGTSTTWSERPLKILEAHVSRGAEPGNSPGEVVRLDRTDRSTALIVACGEGALAITRLQLAGKRALTAEELARGNRTIVGARLGARP